MSRMPTMLQQVWMALETSTSGVAGHFSNAILHSAFQPIVSLSQCRNVGYEALVRATRCDGGTLTPQALFAQVRDEAELVYLDRLCRALHICNFGSAGDAESLIFLNVNPLVSIRGRHYGNFFEEFLAQVGLPPERVVVEILEDSVLDDRQLADSIAFYRDRGCRVAIDDFGAGHSNFGRIWQIKPNIVKLDRSALVFARADPAVRRVLPSLVGILQDAGCLVLVEGIEDEFEAMLAMECGADLAQGYYFGRPASTLQGEDSIGIARLLVERYRGHLSPAVPPPWNGDPNGQSKIVINP